MSLALDFKIVCVDGQPQCSRKISQNPQSIIRAARKGSLPEMIILINEWDPKFIHPQEALGVFLLHLQESRVPDLSAPKISAAAVLANFSMIGLSKIGPYLGANGQHTPRIRDAWQGIYKWSAYLFASRIERAEKNDPERSSALVAMVGCWFFIKQQVAIRDIMLDTPGSIELATRIWLEEPDGPLQSVSGHPPGIILLHNMLENAPSDRLDRVVRTAGGDASKIAKLAVSRVTNSLEAPQIPAAYLAACLDVFNSLSRQRDHPLRRALLGAGAISVATNVLVKISNLVHDMVYMEPMVSAFVYLYNCLESTDTGTWVMQSVTAGLLQAFCDCSPQFSRLDARDLKMVTDVVGLRVMRNLIFRSVIEAVHTNLVKIDRGTQKDLVNASVAKTVWREFYGFAQMRYTIVQTVNSFIRKRFPCDNVKCLKVGTKEDQVRRCGGCLSTFYCSKECQVAAWKEGDHKKMCKLKQRERTEGKSAPISPRDSAFFHDLAVMDIRAHISILHNRAKREYTDTLDESLVVCIDYTEIPPAFSLQRWKEFDEEPRPPRLRRTVPPVSLHSSRRLESILTATPLFRQGCSERRVL
ncbi:hypothetical protein A0H81_10879 [Grifola frondosa]|uniref:MYND-type domain-containing protein n=1 Tax=Grifola frondosa TaxID=5627 RepID=A0A1C7LXC2_GRIFR|nr:hypothetical protein A0H81_10879 [Grifola frondosa]